MKKDDKLDYENVLEKLGNSLPIYKDQVSSALGRRKVWVAAWGIPGCIYESQQFVQTKKQAIDSAISMADSPRGMKTDLRKRGSVRTSNRVSPKAYVRLSTTIVYQTTVADCCTSR